MARARLAAEVTFLSWTEALASLQQGHQQRSTAEYEGNSAECSRNAVCAQTYSVTQSGLILGNKRVDAKDGRFDGLDSRAQRAGSIFRWILTSLTKFGNRRHSLFHSAMKELVGAD